MKPPIPEPTVARPVLERGLRPPALKYFMIGALLFTVAGLLNCDGSMTEISVIADLITYFILSAIWLVLLWFCWMARNWGRIAVMVGCALTVLNLFAVGDYPILQQAVSIVDVFFSVIWFWWLRSPAMVAFSKGKPAPIQTVSALP